MISAARVAVASTLSTNTSLMEDLMAFGRHRRLKEASTLSTNTSLVETTSGREVRLSPRGLQRSPPTRRWWRCAHAHARLLGAVLASMLSTNTSLVEVSEGAWEPRARDVLQRSPPTRR